MGKLITDRCYIVPCEEKHIPLIINMFHEPDSNKFIQPLLEGDEDFWMYKLTTNIAKNKEFLQYWCAFETETDKFVGTLNLNQFSDSGLEQLGVHLSVDFWGGGYGYELCQAILKYAWEVRELLELHWIIEIGHTVSGKLAEKLGFKPFKSLMDGDCELLVYRQEHPSRNLL